jgi:hypothetical protein
MGSPRKQEAWQKRSKMLGRSYEWKQTHSDESDLAGGKIVLFCNMKHFEVKVNVTLWLTVSMSWYRTPLWDLRPDITYCRNVTTRKLRSCFCGAPSLTRGRVCNLQCNHSVVRVAQNPVSSETPRTWRARFPYLYPPGTGGAFHISFSILNTIITLTTSML